MNSTTVAVDLAKNVFELAVADGEWRIVERHRFIRTCEGPSDLAIRPAFRVVKADATNEGTARELLNRPHAVAPQCPMPHEHGELPPGVLT
jgi:hypothetical protein